MQKIRRLFHPREIAIAFVIALAMLITGAFLDWQLTYKVYDPVNTHVFGIFFAGISELPVVSALIFSGTGLIMCTKNRPIWAKIILIVVGVLAILVGMYFTFDTARDWGTFSSTSAPEWKWIFIGLAFAFMVGFTTAVILFTVFYVRKANKETLIKICIVLLATAAFMAVFSNILKYMWGRARPRYIYTLEGSPKDYFDPVWTLHPLRSLIYKIKGLTDSSNNFKSFPSGHTVYATMAVFFLPMLTLLNDKSKHNRTLQVILFYVGLAWTIINAFSRIYAGAHYLSDTAVGIMTTLASGLAALGVTRIFPGERTILKE